ncbi:HD domain-containing protein [Candidatus Dependentiae bacterium]|nr:HD domain-containing protein [Candidatus Dependentiae bacterium]
MTKKLLSLLFGGTAVLAVAFFWFSTPTLSFDTLYGPVTINEPVLVKLIQDPTMQRLKKIHQYGVDHYVIKQEEGHNRFEHSLGVWLLLARYKAPLKEQIAGLLHDVSHTVFSHVGDFVYRKSALGDAYQDDIHESFITNSSLMPLLASYNYTVQDIHHKNKHFTALEPELPEISADRLEYNLSDGFFAGLITKPEIKTLLDAVKFDNNTWYFTDTVQAKKFALISLYLTEHTWGSPTALLIDTWAAEAIRRALELGIINRDEFHHSTDDAVWQKLTQSQDSIIQNLLTKLRNYKTEFVLNDKKYDVVLKAKFRGVNPWVKTTNGLTRLTELDADFKKQFDQLRDLMAKGWHIKFT